MLKFFVFLFAFVSFTGRLTAQNDTNFINYDDNFTVRLHILGPFSSLDVERPGKTVDQMILGTGKSFSYSPNVGGVGTIELSYKGFGIMYNFELSKSYGDEQAGKTNFKDIQIYYYSENFGIDLYYQRIKWFYLTEPEKHGKTSNPFPQMPDLTVNYIGLNLYYIFSPEWFSFKAAFNQTEKQKNSGGSFLFIVSPGYLSASNKQSLILPEEESLYQSDAGFRGGDFVGLAASIGYAHTFVLTENIFISLMYSMGAGGHYHNYDRTSGEKEGFGVLYKTNFRLSVGYNGEKHLFGLSFILDANEYSLDKASLAYVTGRGEAYYGRRF